MGILLLCRLRWALRRQAGGQGARRTAEGLHVREGAGVVSERGLKWSRYAARRSRWGYYSQSATGGECFEGCGCVGWWIECGRAGAVGRCGNCFEGCGFPEDRATNWV